jgi:hypothetical protein
VYSPRRTSQWVADHAQVELRDLPGGHMPNTSELEATAQALRALPLTPPT